MGWVVSVTPWPRFNPGARTPVTHWTGGWVGPSAGLDTETRGKIFLHMPGIEPRSPGRPSRSHHTSIYSYLHVFHINTSSFRDFYIITGLKCGISVWTRFNWPTTVISGWNCETPSKYSSPIKRVTFITGWVTTILTGLCSIYFLLNEVHLWLTQVYGEEITLYVLSQQEIRPTNCRYAVMHWNEKTTFRD
jgi:hypothetical protein